jgi:branched-chain amino acid transport system substrate-binding protein
MVNVKAVTAVIVIIIVIAAAAVLLTQRGGGGTPSTIKIGFFAPLTGPASADGLAARHGAELAVDHINAEGGIEIKGKKYKVELVVYDDQLSSDQVVAVAHKMIEQDEVVAAVSGSYSSTTLAASPVFEDSKVPLVVAYAVNPKITEGKKYVFRVGMLGETEGKAAGYAAVKFFNAKTIAILYIDNPFGSSLAEYAKKKAEEMGAKVVYMNKFKFPTQDFTPWLTEIKQLNPDVLMIFGYYDHTVAVKQARDLGIKAQIIGCEGFDSPKFLEIGGSAVEGVVIVTDLNRDSSNPLVQKFLKEYKERYGIDADMVAASAYDAVRVLAKAIEKAQSTKPDDIVKALEGLKDYDGVTGHILGFTPGHNAIKYITLQIVRNGAFHHFADITEKDIITPSQ